MIIANVARVSKVEKLDAISVISTFVCDMRLLDIRGTREIEFGTIVKLQVYNVVSIY